MQLSSIVPFTVLYLQCKWTLGTLSAAGARRPLALLGAYPQQQLLQGLLHHLVHSDGPHHLGPCLSDHLEALPHHCEGRAGHRRHPCQDQ